MPESLGKSSVLGVACEIMDFEIRWKCYKNVTFESTFGIWDFLLDIMKENVENGV